MEPEDAPVHGPHRNQLGYAGPAALGAGVGGPLGDAPGREVRPAQPQLPSRVPSVRPPCRALGWEGTECRSNLPDWPLRRRRK